MKNTCIVLLTIFIFTACLKAKKSPFDISTPTTGLILGFAASFGSQAANTATTTGTETGTTTSTFSLGGTITGFTTGTLVLQNNNTNDLTLSSVGNYSFSGLASGATYSISVKSHPTGFACTITNATGTLTANVTNVNITCATSTATALYSLGNTAQSYWLDYVKSDGTSPLNATGTACTGTETGFYNACIHAGEFKKISIPNITSCDGITASDSLSAFNWRCVVATNGSISVISTGLRGDKGLSDLIDFTSPGSFRNNSVTVLSNGNSLLTSATGKWWDNSIVVNNSGGVLGTTKTIYIVTNNTTVADYRINVTNTNKIALIVQPGIMKVLNGAGTAINVIDNSFLWIEGSFQSTGTAFVLQFSGTLCKFNVVRKFRGIGDSTATIYNNNGTTSSVFNDISGTNLGAGNFITVDKDKNIFSNVQAYNVSGKGIDIINSDNIILNSFSMNTGGNGIYVADVGLPAVSNIFFNNSAFNASGILLFIEANANRTTTVNTLAANRLSNITAIQASGVSFPKFINTIAAHTTTNSYSETLTTTVDSVFKGIFKVTLASCATLGTNPGVTASCAKTLGAGSELSPATVTGITLANSFVGKVTSDDSKNISDASGSQAFAGITDWLNFENRFRGWGRQGSAFPNTDHTGRCSSGTCQIWDWSLKATDTVARNVNACPNGTIVDTHQWSAATQTACNDFKGAVFTAGVNACVTTFLRNAVEIFGDGVGNENGICESNEECMYTPNIGAYQGHSSDSTNTVKLIPASQSSTTTTTCPDVTAGTVSNVKLWKYDTNGY
ncbi:MAG TPA: hypothetical protein PLX69_04955 [Leptospiraceae bacterium]|nr:hypothetical protein [Leptospiraceae bacterium]HRG73889.1 hypothetical protein [Leptospiraceae bacterium]